MRVKYWVLNVPVRLEGVPKPYSSFVAGKESITTIDVLPGGIVVVGREGATSVVISGKDFGELTEEAEKEYRAAGLLPGGSGKKDAPTNAPGKLAQDEAKKQGAMAAAAPQGAR